MRQQPPRVRRGPLEIVTAGANRSRRNHPVPHTPYCLYPHMGGCQLGSQAGEMHIYCIRAHGSRFFRPYVQGDRAAVHHCWRAPHQKLEDGQLGGGQKRLCGTALTLRVAGSYSMSPTISFVGCNVAGRR